VFVCFRLKQQQLTRTMHVHPSRRKTLSIPSSLQIIIITCTAFISLVCFEIDLLWCLFHVEVVHFFVVINWLKKNKKTLLMGVHIPLFLHYVCENLMFLSKWQKLHHHNHSGMDEKYGLEHTHTHTHTHQNLNGRSRSKRRMVLPRRVLLEEGEKRMGWGTKQSRNLLARLAVRAVSFVHYWIVFHLLVLDMAILGLDNLRNAAHTRTQYYTLKNNIDLVVVKH